LYYYLQRYFQYDQFHEGQEEIITDILNKKDVLGILRTGTGKSLCYQLPAKILSGITIVVSPLISLMLDQVRELQSIHYKEAVALHSFQTRNERQATLKQLHTYKLLNKKDVLGILRTGTGKSLCYQLPAKILSGITIVVSPLISLMLDQVRELQSIHYKEAVALHSFQTRNERQATLKQLHTYKLVY